jgi:putative ABC transport system permease protein
MSTHVQRDDDDRFWRRIRRVFRLPFSRDRLGAEIDAELRFHLEGRVEELMAAQGLTRAAAEIEARRRFGDFAQYQREARAIDETTQRRRERMEIMDALARETHHALRTLARTPRFSLITLLTLALGIGAATAVFTLLDAVVLRPLPYAHAERLVRLSSPVPLLKGQTRWGLARHEMFYFLERGHTLENVGVYNLPDVTVLPGGSGDRPERVRLVQASASLFNVLGFVPERGRLLVPDDNHAELPTVVVLGHAFWQRRFGGDPSVVGRKINVEGFPLTVVGVLPRGASLPDVEVALWAPAHVDSTTVLNNHTWSAIGRLKPGVTAEEAERDLAPLTARLAEVFPQVYSKSFLERTGFRTEVTPLRDAVVGETVTRALWTLFGAVALVLLIGVANVANLFLVRIDTRRREVALRTALGADRAHLAWHYLTESLLLSVAAGLGAIAIGQVMLRLLLAIAPSELPRLSEVHLSGAAIVLALGVALLAGLIFGLLPLMSARLDLSALREGGRGLTTSRQRLNARRLLVATQMAFAVVLLAAAALMLRTFQNLRAVRPGFDPTGVMTVDIALPALRYERNADLASAFHEQLAARLRALPGVRQVGFVDRLPLVDGDWCTGVTLEGPTPDAARGACPPTALVSPGYFEAMGIRVDGRTLDWAGMNAHDGAMVVSRAFAEHWWPGENPIGKGLRFNGTKPPWYRVAGVAEDVRGLGLDAPPIEVVYFPMRPIPGAPLWGAAAYTHLAVRTTSANPLALTSAVSRFVHELDPEAAVANPRTMETVLAKSIAKQSFTMVLLLISAGIAMLLSAVGIYGVISYIVVQRRGEIGVRMALGAQVRQVTLMVLRQSVGLAALGVVVGVLAAVGTTRFLRGLLFGVTPGDPATLVAVPMLLLAVAAVASYLPARHAARVDPVEALRSD